MTKACAAAVTAVLAGCAPNLAIDPGSELTCETAEPGECPDGWVCRTQSQRCVQIDAEDVPPRLEEVTVTPELLGSSGAADIVLVADEPLSAPPILELATELDTTPRRPVALIASEGRRYEYRYAAAGSEPQGQVALLATLIDVVGNVATDLTAGSLTFDFDSPRLLEVTVLDGAPLALTATGRVRLTAAEALAAPPSVELTDRDGTAVPLTLEGVEPPAYTFTHQPTGAEVEDVATPISITLTDLAGNPGGPFLHDAFTFDFTAPSVVDGTTLVLTPQVRVGQVVAVRFDLSEPLANDPVVEMTARQSGDVFALSVSERLGTTWTFTRRVETGDPTDVFDLRLSTYTDRAGNGGLATYLGEVAMDANAPAISTLAVSPAVVSRVAGFDAVRVQFDVDEDVGTGAPGLRVEVGDGVVAAGDCTQTPTGGGPPYAYDCTYHVGATDTPGVKNVVVQVTDTAGNVGLASDRVTLDVEPPVLLSPAADITLLPGDNNPRREPTAVTAGTRVRVSFAFDEAVEIADVPAVTPAVTTTTPAVLELTPVDRSGVFLVYELTFADDTLPEGTYSLEIAARDVAGNAASGLAFPLTFEVDLTPPSPPNVGGLTLTRIPWGSDGPSAAGCAAPAVRCTRVEGGAPIADAGAQWIVYDRSPATPLAEVGRVSIGANGSVARTELATPDLATVYLTALDGAGNESGTAEVKQIEWIATLGHKVAGSEFENPLTFEGRGHVDAALWSAGSRAGDASDGLSTRDPGGPWLTTVAARSWQRLLAQPDPPARRRHGMAYDAGRGRTVTFGGYVSADRNLGDTWEWDGRVWRPVTAVDPEGDGNPTSSHGYALFYDAVEGTVMMFGGQAIGVSVPSADLWSWNGASWKRATPASGPVARLRHAMVWGKGDAVLFGGADNSDAALVQGLDDTWVYAHGAWTIADDGGGPSGRWAHALGYDPVDDVVVLHGGFDGAVFLDDTWEWDGETWTPFAGAPPSPCASHTLVWDDDIGALLRLGGEDDITQPPFEEVWAYDGAAWTSLGASPVLGQRSLHAAARDRLGQIVVFGGVDGARTNRADTVVGDGTTWRRAGPTDPEGDGHHPARLGPAMVAIPGRAEVLLQGGIYYTSSTSWTTFNDSWLWDGASWRQTAVSEPPPRFAPAATWDDERDVTVLFGGAGDGAILGDHWEWSVAGGWVERNLGGGPSNPSIRYAHAMAYDPVRRRVVMFGGLLSSSPLDETWEWDGADWVERAAGPTDPKPAARYYPAMAFDPVRGVTVLFGGGVGTPGAGGPRANDTWVWDGATWIEMTSADPEMDGDPAPRAAPTLTWDPTSERLLLFGGQEQTVYFADSWAWDGASWALLPQADAELDGTPDGRMHHAVAYDEARGGLLLTAGSHEGFTTIDETWLWVGGDGGRPAQALLVPFARAGAPLGSTLAAVAVEWVAGGSGAGSPGAELFVWDRASWLPTGVTNAAPGDAPASLGWSTTSAEQLARLPVTPSRKVLGFAVRPVSGGGAALSEVSSDYVEVSVHYRRP